jgi:hypothetical protein
MTLALKAGKIVGTGTAYAVHFLSKGSTPIGIATVIYAHRKDIQKFAIKHALDKKAPDAVQNNLLNCLEYIE